MLDEIRGDIKLKSYVSYVFAGCMIMITCLSVMIPELKSLYGVNGDIALNFKIRLTIPFQHGFNNISAIIHLVVNLILFWFLGTFIEKIIGSFRFLILTCIGYIIYILFHRLLLSDFVQGFSPIIMTYAGFILVVLNQSKYLKTKSAFEDYYRLLIGVELFIWFVSPFIMTFIPLYYNSNSDIVDAFILGNIYHVMGGVIGLLMGLFYKEHIKKKLLQQMKKKHIKHSVLDKYAYLLALLFPFYMILLLLFKNYLIK